MSDASPTGRSIGVGFIGCGEVAHLHAAALRDLAAAGVPVVPIAAADPEPAQRAAVSRNFAFEREYDRADDLLADPDVDAVWVAVPTALHEPLYEAVLAAGKHLYAEKPIATDLAAVQRLAELAARAPATVQVGFQSRFDPVLLRVREMVHADDIGPTMSYLWRDDEGFPTTAVQHSRSDWRSDPGLAGGGVLIEHSIHAVDALQWIFGPVVKVTASTRNVLGFDVEDTVVLLLEHASGVIGTHVGVYGSVAERELTRIEVQGRDAIIEIERNGVVIDAPNNTFLVQRSRSAPDPIDHRHVLDAYITEHRLDQAPFFLQDLADRAFVASILAGTPAHPDMTDAVGAHAIIDAAYRSAASGATTGLRPPDESPA